MDSNDLDQILIKCHNYAVVVLLLQISIFREGFKQQNESLSRT